MLTSAGPGGERAFVRRVAVILLVTLVPLAFDGCVSVGVSRSSLEPGPGRSGAVELAVYQKERDRDARAPVSFPVLSELYRAEKTGDRLVARSMASAWSLPDLPPGTYRVEMSRRIDERGDIEPLKSRVRKVFEVRAGEKASIAVVLEKVPVVWIVLAAVTVVVLVILSIDWLEKGKIPLPPLPPLPPIHALVVTDFYLSGAPEGHGRAGDAHAPAVADVFPARGAYVAARRVSVTFLLNRPVARDGIAEGAVLALGTRSGEIAGTTSYLPEEQLLRFVPSRDFTPGEDVTVTLDLEKLEGVAGSRGSGRFSTTFRVPASQP